MSKEKVEKLTGERAADRIFEYMKDTNRPYSVQNVFDNLYVDRIFPDYLNCFTFVNFSSSKIFKNWTREINSFDCVLE